MDQHDRVGVGHRFRRFPLDEHRPALEGLPAVADALAGNPKWPRRTVRAGAPAQNGCAWAWLAVSGRFMPRS